MLLRGETVTSPRYGARIVADPDQIRETRERAGLTQREVGQRLAARLDGSQAVYAVNLSRFENGRARTLDPATFAALSAVLAEALA